MFDAARHHSFSKHHGAARDWAEAFEQPRIVALLSG
jgi:hypothetical protein